MTASSDEKGYTMLETIMYISLMILLGTSIAVYIGNVFTRYKTGRVTQQVVDLKKAISQYTAAAADYQELRLSKEGDKNGMMEDKALPLDMKAGVHALGGKIKLGPAADLLAVGNNEQIYNYMFYIIFENLPQKSCMEIITQGQFYGNGSDLDALMVNDYIAMYPYSLFPADGYTRIKDENNKEIMPQNIHITKALEICDKQNDNQITWIFS